MSGGLPDLQRQRAQLLERIAFQRANLSREVAPVQSALNVVDRATQAAHNGLLYLKAHPLPVALVVSALVLVRPRRVWGLLGKGMVLWRGWRSLQTFVPPAVQRQFWDRVQQRFSRSPTP